jgi:predicted phosphoserine aminotransferase
MHRKLFIPGPSEVIEENLQYLATPQVGHRLQEYKNLHGELIPKLKKMLYTEQDVLLFTCSSTGVMEGAMRNFTAKKALIMDNGAFANRFDKIAKSNNLPHTTIKIPWGKGVTPQMVEDNLKTGDYDVMAMVFNETSVGVRSPLEPIANVMKKYPDVCFVVDAVSGMAGDMIKVDEWGIDCVLAGLQKCFALPAGLTVATMSTKAAARAEKVSYRGYYTDFLDAKKKNDQNQTPSTPSIPHIFALNHQMDRIQKEGFEKRCARHLEMAKIVRKWAVDRGFELFPDKGFESHTLTCIKNSKGISVAGLNDHLKKYWVVISNGYGDLKEKTFRIAHMGDCTVAEINELLGWIDEYLA